MKIKELDLVLSRKEGQPAAWAACFLHFLAIITGPPPPAPFPQDGESWSVPEAFNWMELLKPKAP